MTKKQKGTSKKKQLGGSSGRQNSQAAKKKDNKRAMSLPAKAKKAKNVDMTQYPEEDPDDHHPASTGSIRATPQKPNAQKFFGDTITTGVENLKAEFGKLRDECAATAKSLDITTFSANPTLNRYKDVLCLEATRVVLTDGDGIDYIHANYVASNTSANRFICTQAPMNTSIPEFWRMIYQEKTECIIMLCDFTKEKGDKKKNECAVYWPSAPPTKDQPCKTFAGGKLTVEFVSDIRKEKDIISTQLQVTRNGKPQTVIHHRWTTWPDKSVPNDGTTVMRLLKLIKGIETPVVVHCSAGIGRTGTLVVIEMCLSLLEKNEELNVRKVVKTVREGRLQSIQTNIQYLYVYKVLLEECVGRRWVTIPSNLKKTYDTFCQDYAAELKKTPQKDTN